MVHSAQVTVVMSKYVLSFYEIYNEYSAQSIDLRKIASCFFMLIDYH
jgi:hypothetical protein